LLDVLLLLVLVDDLCILAIHFVTESLDQGDERAKDCLEEAENTLRGLGCAVDDSVIDHRHENAGIRKQEGQMFRQEHAKSLATEHVVQKCSPEGVTKTTVMSKQITNSKTEKMKTTTAG